MNDETRDSGGTQPKEQPEAHTEAPKLEKTQQAEDAQERDLEQIQVLPLVALRDTVIFPEMIVPLQVGGKAA